MHRVVRLRPQGLGAGAQEESGNAECGTAECGTGARRADPKRGVRGVRVGDWERHEQGRKATVLSPDSQRIARLKILEEGEVIDLLLPMRTDQMQSLLTPLVGAARARLNGRLGSRPISLLSRPASMLAPRCLQVATGAPHRRTAPWWNSNWSRASRRMARDHCGDLARLAWDEQPPVMGCGALVPGRGERTLGHVSPSVQGRAEQPA